VEGDEAGSQPAGGVCGYSADGEAICQLSGNAWQSVFVEVYGVDQVVFDIAWVCTHDSMPTIAVELSHFRDDTSLTFVLSRPLFRLPAIIAHC
jgi:hypothetical protein